MEKDAIKNSTDEVLEARKARRDLKIELISFVITSYSIHYTKLYDSTDDDQKGRFFDYWAIHHLANRDIEALVSMEREALEQVQECGLRSFLMMLGILYQEKYQFNLISRNNFV